MSSFWMPKKQPLYAPMIASFGGGSASGWGRGRGGPLVFGEAFFKAGNYNWVVPPGVTKISIVAVGAGGTAGNGGTSSNDSAGGGALAYTNSVPVTPGSIVFVSAGAKSISSGTTNADKGGDSYVTVSGTDVCRAGGGEQAGGTLLVGDGGGGGGSGGTSYRGGGGGAGGYAGAGGSFTGSAPLLNSGASAGGGTGSSQAGTDSSTYTSRTYYGAGGGGGGVGLFGIGADGIPNNSKYGTGNGGGGGGGGSPATTPFQVFDEVSQATIDYPLTGFDGENSSGYASPGAGGYPGGGGGAGGRYIRTRVSDGVVLNTYYGGAQGADGAVRIIWGKDREFPSLNVTPDLGGQFFIYG